jgi:hypothetical protein
MFFSKCKSLSGNGGSSFQQTIYAQKQGQTITILTLQL